MTRRTVAVAVLGAAGLASALATTANAGPLPHEAVDGGMVAAMARDLRLTPDQARARLDREAVAARTESVLKARLGPGFAGAWMAADASGLVVGVTDVSQIQAVEAAGARAEVVGRSLAELDAVKARLDRNARGAPKSVPGWYVATRRPTRWSCSPVTWRVRKRLRPAVGNCTSGGTIYFQSVDEILQVYGLRLVVGDGTPPTSTTSTTTTSTDPGQTTWRPGVAYATGSLVTYGGVGYRCLQGHTSQPGWDPPTVPALWERV